MGDGIAVVGALVGVTVGYGVGAMVEGNPVGVWAECVIALRTFTDPTESLLKLNNNNIHTHTHSLTQHKSEIENTKSVEYLHISTKLHS